MERLTLLYRQEPPDIAGIVNSLRLTKTMNPRDTKLGHYAGAAKCYCHLETPNAKLEGITLNAFVLREGFQ